MLIFRPQIFERKSSDRQQIAVLQDCFLDLQPVDVNVSAATQIADVRQVARLHEHRMRAADGGGLEMDAAIGL